MNEFDWTPETLEETMRPVKHYEVSVRYKGEELLPSKNLTVTDAIKKLEPASYKPGTVSESVKMLRLGQTISFPTCFAIYTFTRTR